MNRRCNPTENKGHSGFVPGRGGLKSKGDIPGLELGIRALELRLATEGTDAGIRVGELGAHEPPPARGHVPPNLHSWPEAFISNIVQI